MIKNKNKDEFEWLIIEGDNKMLYVRVFYMGDMIGDLWCSYMGSCLSFISIKYRSLYGYKG